MILLEKSCKEINNTTITLKGNVSFLTEIFKTR